MVLGRLFRGKKGQEGLQIPRSAYLKVKPVKNPALKWERDKKTREIKIRVSLTPQSQNAQKKKGIFDKLFSSGPSERIINLDKIGSIVWDLCDGERTIGDIAKYFVEKYKLLPEEAEISLTAYLNQLSRRGLIGYIVPEDIKEQLEKTGVLKS